MQILHITAHLGGGVGKAISGLVIQSSIANPAVEHIVVCLEKPHKSQFVDQILATGSRVVISPSQRELTFLIDTTDILQLEWWNNPATLECLCNTAFPPVRLLTWCHISGLHNPVIPKKLIERSQRFIFTSPCSYETKEVRALQAAKQKHLDVISSSGGFSALPLPALNSRDALSVGYIGSLNFAKLHPDYVTYLAAVTKSDFQVRMIGDPNGLDKLSRQCNRVGRPNLLEFRGYTNDIVAELSQINVLAYLLNQDHYGTTENALLEAMAMGIVPIVLDNPAERHIVEHRSSGLIVRSPEEFAQAINWLADNPHERLRMSKNASESVRHNFTAEKMEAALMLHYSGLMKQNKITLNFREIFGQKPADWFVSCQGNPAMFCADGTINASDNGTMSAACFERNKGSALHFSRYFPKDSTLTKWADNLRELR